ncbi:MAG: hypothetical protein EPO36_03635 [Chloroflexota bacterium]|nr:MAG: hypothetical protein EPO36_03635 [Chloroflexota bacterium]
MAALDDLARRLDAATAAMLAMQGRVDDAGPWPLAELYGTEAEASWGPPELLAHVDEMLPYWLGHAERVIDGARAGTDVAFGRTAEDPIRIGVIGRDREMPLRELFSRLGSEGARVTARLRMISPAEATAAGTHQTRGPFTVEALFERFVVGHLEDHVRQLEDILATRGA